MFDLALLNGMIVTPEGVFKGNLYAANGKIAALTDSAHRLEARQVLDASGKYVFPGAIDVHAHLNDPGFTWREDFAHGTRAAVFGGVTTVVDMPLQNEPALTTAALFHRKDDLVRPSAWADYAFWGGLVEDNLSELKGMHDAGVVAFKVFIGPVSPDYSSLNMGQVRRAMQTVAAFGGMIGFHAEDYSVIKHEEELAQKKGTPDRRDFLNTRPADAEILAVRNVIDLMRRTGVRAHICHVSHPDAAELIAEAQREGLPLTAETCSHYLTFTEDDLMERGMLFKCAPPLRTASERDRLWSYVADGTLSCVASDHSPCAPHEKDERQGTLKAWGGISGIQSLVQVFFDQAVVRRGFSPELVAQRLSEGPARAFGLWGRKGALLPGFDADIVVLNPRTPWTITPDSLHYLNRISAFTGLSGTGLPETTILRGSVVCSGGEFTAQAASGTLVRRNA
ncbi:MAG: allantoinase AllB [Pyramidobacter sp.]|nr:allantoinase AllB [Pyramidobacter sp.]